jgi:GntR family transcriptional regulator, transcriptional repressor for pyruvate dehydrogenase complex
VRKAYEQVADQLRELIVAGELRPGQRLPPEHNLARDFGVSRTTVREALRALAAEQLIRTVEGAAGGSFVSSPTADHISEFLSANLSLLARENDVTLDDFLEAREQLEVPAARLAAERRSDEELERLRESIVPDVRAATTPEQFELNRSFHDTLVEASSNPLLLIATQPIFVVLQTRLARSTLGIRGHRIIREGHVRIADAVGEGDANRAEREMRAHLVELRPLYERAWRRIDEATRALSR